MVPGKRGRPSRDAAPRTFLRRGVYAADLRRWDLGRPTLRDPDAPTWPRGGEPTDDPEVALRWALTYVDHARDEARRRHLKLGPRARKLGGAADDWILHREESRRPATTVLVNRSALNSLRRFAAEDKESGRKGDDLLTDRLTTALLQRWFDQLIIDGYARNTLANYRQSTSGFLRWLGQGANNAATAVVLPSPDEHEEVGTWTDEEMAAIRSAADRLDRSDRFSFDRFRLAVELALATGLRRNELFALDWRAFNIEERTVRVSRQLHKSRPEFVVTKSKKARTALVLPTWWEHHDPDAQGLVLSRADGSPLMPQWVPRLFRRLFEEAGVYRDGIGLHAFRHTYARDFIEGVRGDFGLLQKSLGHKSIVTTEKLYGHFHDDRAAGIARARIYPEERLRAV